MTVPNFDFLKQDGVSPDNSPAGAPDFSFLETPEREIGVFERSINFLTNVGKTAMLSEYYNGAGGVGVALTMRKDIDDLLNNPLTPEEYQTALAKHAAEPSAFEINKEKFYKLMMNRYNPNFGEGTGEKIKQFISTATSTAINDPIGGTANLAGTLIQGVSEMAFRPIEVAFGADISDTGVTPYTPERRADEIRNLTGDVVMMAVTGGTTSVARKAMLGEALTAAQIAEKSALKQIWMAGRGQTKLGVLAKTITADVVGGAAGGVAQTAIQSAGSDDIVADMLINGFLMAPVGIAFDAVRGNYGPKALSASLDRAKLAGELFNLHQLQDLTSKSLPEILETVEHLKSADTFADVLMQRVHDPDFEFSNPILLKGLTIKKAIELDKNKIHAIAGQLYHMTTRKVDTDVYDAIIVPVGNKMIVDFTLGEAKRNFENSGFIKGEVVVHKGKEHAIHSIYSPLNGGEVFLNLLNENGGIVKAELGDIQRKATTEFAADVIITERDISLKRAILDEKDVNNSKFIRELEYNIYKAVQRARNGESIDIPLFRQDRGGRIPGTGVFYATTVNHANRYGSGNNTFHVSRVKLNKPFIVDGGHKNLIDNIDRYFGQDITPQEKKALQAAAELTYEKQLKPQVVNTYNPKRAESITPQGVHPESGYQLMDKILARILRRLGFDGIIYDKGFDTEIVTYNATIKDQTLVHQEHRGFDLGEKRAQEFLLNEHFSEYINSRFPDLNAYVPENFDFSKDLWEFAENKGILRSQFNAYRREFSSRFANFVQRNLDTPLKEQLKQAQNALELAEKQMFENAKSRSMDLINAANIANMLVDIHNGGAIALRDAKSGKIVQLFDSVEDAHKFVVESGIPDAVGLVKGEIPTGITPPPNSGARQADWNFDPDKNGTNAFERFINGFYSSAFAKYITPVGEYMKAVDNSTGLTDLFSKVFDPTQVAFRKYIAQVDGYRRTIEPLVKKMRKLSRAERELISEYRETRSLEEILKEGITKGRKPTEAEINNGNWLADNNIDTKQVFNYRAERRQLDNWYEKNGGITEQMPDGSQQPREIYKQDILELNQKYWADKDDIHWKAVDLFDETVRGPFAQSSLYSIVKIADAKRFGTLSRKDFAKKHNLNSVQLEVAQALDNLYEVLAKEFGIEDNQYILGYMNHYRDYGAGIVTHNADLGYGNAAEQKFLSELTRTGEISDYIRDPIAAFEHYVVQGFKGKTKFFEAHAAAQEALDKNIRHLLQKGDNATARALQERVGQYLHEINGRRSLDKNSDAEAMSKTVVALNKAFPFLKLDKYFADRLTRAFLSASETAAQGLRPVAGIRDYFGVAMNYGVKFGLERSRSALFIGLDDSAVQALIDAKIIPDNEAARANPQQALAESGETPTLNAMQLIDPAAVPTGVSTRLYSGLEKAAEIGLKGSLQDRAYKRAHAGIYVDTWKRTGDALANYASGKVGKEATYNKIQINAYDVSIQKHFDSLVEEGKYQDAARFLGRVTAAETVFTYGAAGHPYGWSSNFGRLFGQFGLWGTYQLRYLSRLYSQGTFKQIAARSARFAVIFGGAQLAHQMTGVDFSSWFSTPGTLVPTGGPAFQIAGSLIGATSTSEWERQKSLAELRRFNPFHQFPSNLGQIYLPFSYATEDWLRAYDMFYNERFNPFAALGQAAGLKQDLYRDHRSWVDEIMGFSPQLKGER